MTEYELTYLLGETVANTQAMFMNIFAILSGYLLVAFFLAKRLTTSLSWFVNGLFTFAILVESSVIYRHVEIQVSLTRQIAHKAALGEGLSWHPVLKTPDWVMDIAPVITTAVFYSAAAAAIYFFCHARRTNSDAP
jgi:small-conductance mechanosensitive channel